MTPSKTLIGISFLLIWVCGCIDVPKNKDTKTPTLVESITITPTSLRLYKGANQMLDIQAINTDGTMVDLNALTLQSSNTDVASFGFLNEKLTVVALDAGTSTLSACAKDGAPCASIAVDVLPYDAFSVEPASVSLQREKTQSLALKFFYKGQVVPYDGTNALTLTEPADQKVVVGFSETNSNTILVTGKALGKTNFTISDGVQLSQTVDVNVFDQVGGIVLDPPAITLTNGRNGSVRLLALDEKGDLLGELSQETWSVFCKTIKTSSAQVEMLNDLQQSTYQWVVRSNLPNVREKISVVCELEGGKSWTASSLVTAAPRVQLVSGAMHTCAFLSGFDSIGCWGLNHRGQLGKDETLSEGNYELSPHKTINKFVPNIVAMGAGYAHTCALGEQGQLACWGANDSGQLAQDPTRMINTHEPRRVAVDGQTWSSLGVGGFYTCATTVAHELYCWGNNDSGQLGIGTSESTHVPTQVEPSIQWHHVWSGRHHTCATSIEGLLYCWGSNSNQQVGSPSEAIVMTPKRVVFDNTQSHRFRHVGVGIRHTCGVTYEDQLYCWGRNTERQVGISQGEDALPQRVKLEHRWDDVFARGNYTCGGTAERTLFCWGAGDYGQTGDVDLANYSAESIEIKLDKAFDVSLGDEHACAIDKNDKLYCWGHQAHGRLGDSVTGLVHKDAVDVGAGLPRDTRFIGLAAGNRHMCGITVNATMPGNISERMVHCWGRNRGYRLGGPLSTSTFSQANRIGLDQQTDKVWQSIKTNVTFGCASDYESLWCWGNNGRSQLTTKMPDSGSAKMLSVQLPASNKITSFDLGAQFGCILLDSQVYCWGENQKGQTGQPTIGTNTLGLQPVMNAMNSIWRLAVTHIATGLQSACAISSVDETNSVVYCWGKNFGPGNTDDYAPTKIGVLTGSVMTLVGGDDHFCAGLISEQNTGESDVYCWGTNSRGQTTGDLAFQPTPLKVALPPENKLIELAAGVEHSCALVQDKMKGLSMYCWGNNLYAQLGIPKVQNHQNVPVRVGILPKGVMDELPLAQATIALGDKHTCVQFGARAYCWGSFSHGQLGHGEVAVRANAGAPVVLELAR